MRHIRLTFESHELLRLCSIATVIFDPLKRSSSPPSTFPRYISRGVQPRQHHREIQFFVSFNSVLYISIFTIFSFYSPFPFALNTFLRSVLALLRSEITLSINSVHFLLSALSSPSPSPPPPPPPLLRPIFSIVRFSTPMQKINNYITRMTRAGTCTRAHTRARHATYCHVINRIARYESRSRKIA